MSDQGQRCLVNKYIYMYCLPVKSWAKVEFKSWKNRTKVGILITKSRDSRVSLTIFIKR